MGYLTITRKEAPYPTGGYRMQYALNNAIQKSGLGLPHTVFYNVWVMDR